MRRVRPYGLLTAILMLSLATGCYPHDNSIKGGSPNGQCEWAFNETTPDGIHRDYPELAIGDNNIRYIIAKVIIKCGDHPPVQQRLELSIEFLTSDRWAQRGFNQTNEVPRPNGKMG